MTVRNPGKTKVKTGAIWAEYSYSPQ